MLIFSPARLLASLSSWLRVFCGWISERSGNGAKASRPADANVWLIGATNGELGKNKSQFANW